ncbi:MAG: hypothetical protein ACRCXK_04305 [Wohlfahrtiimonas sp.]
MSSLFALEACNANVQISGYEEGGEGKEKEWWVFVKCEPKSSQLKEAKGAFTPDANEALHTNDLHVKSMQRRDRQSCGAISANGANYATRIERLMRQ